MPGVAGAAAKVEVSIMYSTAAWMSHRARESVYISYGALATLGQSQHPVQVRRRGREVRETKLTSLERGRAIEDFVQNNAGMPLRNFN